VVTRVLSLSELPMVAPLMKQAMTPTERSILLGQLQRLVAEKADQICVVAGWNDQEMGAKGAGPTEVLDAVEVGKREDVVESPAALVVARHFHGRFAATLSLVRRSESDQRSLVACLAHLEHRLHERGVVMLQLGVRNVGERADWESIGYWEIANLRYLMASVPVAETGPLLDRVSIGPLPEDATALSELLEATFIDSLDCPTLSNIRTTSDTLAGYEDAIGCDRDCWRGAWLDGTLAGLLIVTPDRQSSIAELTYMGVRPSFRGRGIGKSLVAEAFRLARGCRATHLVLGVDQRNRPAATLYGACGFVEYDSEVVFGKVLAISTDSA
jgi:GNAT superfamily N-acetyltransferase